MRLVLVLGLAFVLAGCDRKTELVKGDAAPVIAADQGVIAITVGGEGFQPSSVKFKKGAPATLVFTRTTDETCATEVVFPQLDIKKDLPKNTPVTVTVPTDKEQKLTFQCGMGMYKSSVLIAPGS